MSTPTKPERVEVGQRRQHPTAGLGPFVVLSVGDLCRIRYENTGNEYNVEALLLEERPLVAPAPATPGTATVTPAPKPKRVEVGQQWSNPLCDPCYNPSTIIEALEYGGAGGEPRVPGFLMRTANGQERHWPANKILTWDYVGRDASKPPATPAYGRLVGELRAPDGTPRTALEAIQAKREPEPWVPSCDIDCDIPDADEGWRR